MGTYDGTANLLDKLTKIAPDAYQNFDDNNFIIEPVSIGIAVGGSVSSVTKSITKNYNPTTGVLTYTQYCNGSGTYAGMYGGCRIYLVTTKIQ